MQDRRVTVRELAEEVGISTGSVHSILTNAESVREIRAEATAYFSQLIETFLVKHSCGSTGSLLFRHGCLQFLAFPPPENAAEMDSI
jgi:AcrR family transcriptional regulator